MLVALCSLGAGCGPLTGMLGASEDPNVILILTDDLDARLLQDHPDDYPNLRRLAAEGTTFENAFVSDPLCCPSRATILRGQYAHNHQIAGNWWPQGGARKFRKLGHEDSTVATWLQDQGYRTVLVGKYMNDYDGEHVPKGWDDWYAIVGSHLSEDLNENGRVRHYGSERHHLDDVLAEKAAGYLPRAARSDAPFFMWVGTQAPHAPATPAPRHEEAFQDARLPRGPSFDEEGVWDKPGWVRDNPRLRHKRVEPMQDLYRDRLRSMLAVDEMVGRLVDALESRGELDNTYLFFTSDNGWHAGEHRLTAGKWTAYEEDIRVPLIVRGPGVPEGETLPHLVLNNDLAPTFADLAGAAGEPGPPFVDGRSLAPLLDEDPPAEEDWRSAFLVEAAAEQGPSAVPPLSGDRLPKEWWRAPQEDSQEGSQQDWGRPRLKAVRTEDHIYVEYATGPRELYDLEKDPYQVNNRYYTADPELVRNLEERLAALRDCSGPDCRAAEDAP
ncbi:MAG: sulfatase [Actinomycetota bacterium]|nr:sulfatase [Actinomycetota bacterium]